MRSHDLKVRKAASDDRDFEDSGGKLLGFIHLQTQTDYFTQEQHGRISDVIVSAEGEGKGVGQALMQAGEDWARRRGYRMLTLNVFTQNHRARNFYQRLGYGEDTMKYVKRLD